jgi:hypothetical protein
MFEKDFISQQGNVCPGKKAQGHFSPHPPPFFFEEKKYRTSIRIKKQKPGPLTHEPPTPCHNESSPRKFLL